MPIEIRPFSAEWRQAVRAFNERLDARGIEAGLRLPVDPETEMLPGSESYLAVENGVVRGGYTLRPQQFSIGGEMRSVAHFRLPVSEGIIDRKYAMLGALLVRSAIEKQPLLYALGMGGADRPLPRMLQAMGWGLSPVPFYFRVVHAPRFLREIRAARQSHWRAGLMDFAASTGVGWIGIHAAQFCRSRWNGLPAMNEIGEFDSWADEIWQSCYHSYGMIAERSSEVLRQLYPRTSTRFRIQSGAAGWAVVLDTAMQDDPYFGDLRVGTIVDCLAKPLYAGMVIHSARVHLERRGVDLIISNQGHPAWTEALERDGFFKGPSNFLFAASPALCALGISEWHMNRGDGDGPVHL